MPRRLACVFTLFLFSFFYSAASQGADTTAPGLLLAKVYNHQDNLDDYWVSEKLDGVRAYWDGRRFLSRQGNVYHAPAWFSAGFPDQPLDGELWMGRGTFDTLSGAVRQQVSDDTLWRQIRYMVFDLPESHGLFDQRLARLKQLLAQVDSAYIAPVVQYRVTSRTQLRQRLSEVVGQGGEGLMLHRGDSLYRAARSDALLKLKTHDDAEAVVVAHLPGQGKYQGMLGSMRVEMPNGQQFRIGTGFSDAERANPPAVGTTITYKYFGKTRNGIPRFASFLRVREVH